jgi:hypothetical protein
MESGKVYNLLVNCGFSLFLQLCWLTSVQFSVTLNHAKESHLLSLLSILETALK